MVQVDLEQTNPDLVGLDSKRPMSNPDPAYFNTQLQLLTSDTLLRCVVKEHSLDTNKDFLQATSDGSVSAWRSVLKAIGLASDPPKKLLSPPMALSLHRLKIRFAGRSCRGHPVSSVCRCHSKEFSGRTDPRVARDG